uniref:Glycosyltransferase n=1 Tax=Oryza glumipatula TaxID=40148 RepID=A0A0E0AH08_9ORYZ
MAATPPPPPPSPLHIVVFPWLAFGHMIPFLELSKRLARRGHAITFVSTPRNAGRLGAIPPAMSAHLRVVSLDLPAVDGLPEGAESTADVPPEKIACAIFSIFPAALGAFVGTKQENLAHPRTTTEDYMAQPAWIPFPSTVTYRRHEAEWIAASFRPNASGVSDADRFWDSERPSCHLIIYRSCPEAEPRLFPLLTKLYTKPAIPSGLLVPPALDDNDIGVYNRSDQSFVAVMQWLDKQPIKSVIYVSLGTEAPITADHMHELAFGLELAGVRFLWALRRPSGINCHDDMLLPSGFETRVAARGLVCTEWVSQVRVLAHGAVGAFLTHCGWGSTVESFHYGQPLVMLPFIADQGLIAQAVAATGVGVEVARNYDDGLFYRDDVAAAIQRVMVEEEGKELAHKAIELRGILGDRVRQEMYLYELIGYLQCYK